MGRKKSENGGRRRGGRRASSPRAQDRGDAAHNRSGAGGGMSGSSRLLLTRLLREGAIWDVYVATSAQAGGQNTTRLEFERSGGGQGKVRYGTPVEGPLLDALHSGAPVSRSDLERELELAIRQAGAGSPDSQ